MLKRIFLFVFVLSTLALVALVPMNVSPASENTAKLQVTLPPVTPVVTVAVVTSTPSSTIPAAGGLPISTLVIIGLLVILGFAIIIGGMVLMNNSRR